MLWEKGFGLLAWTPSLFIWLFWGHTRQYSGLTHGFVLRDHSWQAWGTIWGAGDRISVSVCKASALPAVVLLWPLDTLVITLPCWGPFSSSTGNKDYNPNFMMRMHSPCVTRNIQFLGYCQAGCRLLLKVYEISEKPKMNLSFCVLICFALSHIHSKFCLQM